MHIDDELIGYLETLSCLSLQEDEKSGMKKDLENILGYMAGLEALDTEGVPERSHPFDHVNAFREDDVQASIGRADLLENAPESGGGAFAVPRMME